MQRSTSAASLSRLNMIQSGWHTFILDFPEEFDQALIWAEVDEISISPSQSSSENDEIFDDSTYTDDSISSQESQDNDNQQHFPPQEDNIPLPLNQAIVLPNPLHDFNIEPMVLQQLHPQDNDDDDHHHHHHLDGQPELASQEAITEGTLGQIYNRVLTYIQSTTHHIGARNLLLFRIIAATEEPLIRADIHWGRAMEEIPSYPAATIGDTFGSVLLEATLRMDPPLNVVQAIVSKFPMSSVNMDCFYAACLHSTSNSVLRFILDQTMIERKKRGIGWGMLAFLGDARINTRQATYLIEAAPTAITDPDHGMFGVCPLDRMLSGAFIHGCSMRWVRKLKLAFLFSEAQQHDCPLLPSETPSPNKSFTFFFYHALIRRLISTEYKGMQFGALTFLRSLDACVKASVMSLDAEEQVSYLDAYDSQDYHIKPFQQIDDRGRLPLHVLLASPCQTNLGVVGERKLIQFLLSVYPESAQMSTPIDPTIHLFYPSSVEYSTKHTIRRKTHWLPLQMSIINGWPCYDLITSTNPLCVSDPKHNIELEGEDLKNLALHVVLSGPFHPRFGIRGARRIIQYLLRRNPQAAITPNGRGRLPLHLAIENRWPVHDLIVAMAPATLDQCDGWSQLYPFQIAAAFGRPSHRWLISKVKKRKRGGSNRNVTENESDVNRDIDLSHLSLIYELIREAPLSCHGLAKKS